MANERVVVALEDNLFFTGKIDNAASDLGYQVIVAGGPSKLAELMSRHRPSLVIVDLSTEDIDWANTLGNLKSEHPEATLLAFGPHVEEELLETASNAGCDLVLSQGEFSSQLPDLLKTYGG